MKITVVGCGALGSYYGACLQRAGHAVTFLLRSDYEAVRTHGVRVRSFAGDFTAHPRCVRTPDESGPAELVLIGLKTTVNGQFPRLLGPLVGPLTAVLTLQNGLGNEEALAALFPSEQILGGLCFVCLNRTAPGVIHHLAHGRILLGEYQRPATARTRAFAEYFRLAGVPCDVTDHLSEAHWQKLVWNIAFNGLGVASAAGHAAWETNTRTVGPAGGECLTTDRLLADPAWTGRLRALMAEILASAEALGHQMPPDYAELQISRTREMGAYRPSTLIDFERGQPLELDSLFFEPLRQARAAGVATPTLERLCELLEGLAKSGPPSHRS
jgi:2-dehydropantoate 2-reductase